MNLNVTVNEACPPAPSPGSGALQVRAYYLGQSDAGHVYGPLATREQAEKCLLVLAARAEVRAAKIEPAS